MLLEDVHQYQPHRPADGGVGPVARTQQVVGAIEADALAYGAVDQHEDAGRVGGGGGFMDAVGIVVEEGLHRGQYDGEVAREAPGHNRISGRLLRRQDPAAHLDLAQDLVRSEPDVVQHLRYAVHRRRHHG